MSKLKEITERDSVHSAHIKMNRGELLNPVWTGDTDVTGGFLYETTIHLFDMMRFQFGEISELVAYGSQHEYPEIDEFSIIFKFKNGFHCTFASSSDASWHFPFERIEAFCHHRTIMTEEMERLFDSNGTDPNFETHSFHMVEKEERWGYVQEDASFIDSILSVSKPAVGAIDGFKSVELVESVYEAIKTGERSSLIDRFCIHRTFCEQMRYNNVRFQATVSKMIQCNKCGQANARESNFCRFCGTKMVQPQFDQFFPQAQPNQVRNETSYEYNPPRPHAWKTDEFQATDDKTRQTQQIGQFQPLAKFNQPQAHQNQSIATFQQNNVAYGYRCPRCATQILPQIQRKISNAGWAVFAIVLVVFFPLFWIGLLIKEDVRVCPVCNLKIN